MHRLLKLGRVRVSLSPNPFARGKPFAQTLILRDGCCRITAGDKGSEVRLRILVDADSQTVYVSGQSDQPLTVTATLENWRTKPKALQPDESASTWIFRGGIPANVGMLNEESADVILENPGYVIGYHRNEHSPVPTHVKYQHLEAFAGTISDPILHRTFGSMIFGPGFVSNKPSTVAMKEPARSFDLRIATHAAQDRHGCCIPEGTQEQASDAVAPDKAAERTRQWWSKFWDRSWVFVGEPSSPLIPANKYLFHSNVTQAYILTRYQFACQQRSPFPSHFNGGIFTVAPDFAYYATDPRGKNWSAHYRFYGPSYWWQNTRFMYQLHLCRATST